MRSVLSRQRYYKKWKLESIPYEFKYKNPQQNTSKANIAIYKKKYLQKEMCSVYKVYVLRIYLSYCIVSSIHKH
jgi:hypothetical protein